MLFKTDALTVDIDKQGIAHLVFDLQKSSVNTFSCQVLSDLTAASQTQQS